MCDKIQLFIQTFIYFIIAVLGFAISIPVGLTVNQFDGGCILFADITWKNKTFQFDPSPASLCNFPVGVAVLTCIIYGVCMGSCNLCVICRSKDPKIIFKMRVIPFINCLVTILVFAKSFIISMGLQIMCHGFTKGYDGVNITRSCNDVQKVDWDRFGVDGTHFYSYLTIAEVATWITFALWVIQISPCFLRCGIDRRRRANKEGTTNMPA